MVAKKTPTLVAVGEELLGPNLCLFSSHYISKPAATGLPVLWHQDGSYFPLQQTDPSVPMGPVNMWLAIDDSVAENGCLQVIPGSHTKELAALRERQDIENVLNSEIAELVDESKAIDLVLKKGDISIHHPNIIHGSQANKSNMRRCGLTIRYMPTTTRLMNPSLTNNLFLLKGKPVPGVNTYRPYPKYVEGKSFPFEGCNQWNEYKKTRQGDISEFTEAEEQEMLKKQKEELNIIVGDPAAKKLK